MKKRVRLEEIKRLFEAYEELTVNELHSYTGIAIRTIRDYLKILIEDNLIIAIGSTNKRYYKRTYAIDENPIVVDVWQNHIKVGTISFSYAKGYNFAYASSYHGKKLPSLPDDINHSYGLFSVFENLIPESTRRERLLLKDGKILNPLELLLELDNTHGNFDFVAVDTDISNFIQNRQIPSWKSIKNHILGTNDFVNLLDFEVDIPQVELQGNAKSRELYSSLSGYQHKIDVNLDFDTHTIKRVDKSKKELAHYLLKPYASDKRIKYTPYLALNEHLFMSFAKNILKLDVPYSAIILGEHKDFYFLVKRYDRYKGYKYQQYDFAQYLDIESEEKYDITITSILKLFATLVKDKKSKEDVFVFIVYASLIKHGDLHAKNIGLIETTKDKWELAPLYDIISTYVYEGKNSDDFGISFDKSNPKKRKLRYKEYLLIADILDISSSRAKLLLKNTIKRFQIFFPNYIKTTQGFEQTLGYAPKLSKKLNSLYIEKNIELDKLGILKEIGLKRENCITS